MSGVNPQECQVCSFKQPSREDLDHDFLWRYAKSLPERGRIGIFNRSYYEEVLVVRVHEEILNGQKLPPPLVGKRIWDERLADIANFEDYLDATGHDHSQVLSQCVAQGAEKSLYGAARQTGKALEVLGLRRV